MAAKVRYKIFPRENYILQEFRGDFNFDDIKKALLDIWKDPGYNPSCNGLSDFRKCRLQMSAEDMHQFIAFFVERKKEQSKIALLTTGPMDEAMALYFSKRLKSLHNANNFSSPAEACSFLNINTASLELLQREPWHQY